MNTVGSYAPSARKRAFISLAIGLLAAVGITLIEQIRGFGGARVAEGVCLLAALATAAWAVPEKLRNVFVVACSLVFGLTLLEGAILVKASLSRAPSRAIISNDGGLGSPRPVLGWGPPRPGIFHTYKIAADGKTIYDARVTIDSALNRKTEPSSGPHSIAFFGDSWIFGDGVEDTDTLPQAFADLERRKIPVLNLGFNGWSPAVNLAALQTGTYKSLLQQPGHFVLFTATFHLERTACKASYATTHAPRFVLDGDTVKYTGTCAEAEWGLAAPLIRFLQKFELYNRFAPKLAAPDRMDVETYIKIIETFVGTAQRIYGVKTTVLFAPFRDEYIKNSGYTEDAIITALRQAGIDVLIDDLPPIADQRLYWIPNDGHPTALANKARAQQIETHLKQVDPTALDVEASSH